MQLRKYFSYKKSLSNTAYRQQLSAFTETTRLYTFSHLMSRYLTLQHLIFDDFYDSRETRAVANCVFKDMLHLVCMWRQIRGYPQGGNTTHTNSNTSKKNKLLLNFRVSQFYKTFGKKRRNVYPTLVKAEYNNRLWFYNWRVEWLESAIFAIRMAKAGQKAGGFNPALLAGNQTNGYTRVGKAAKIGKAKKLVKVFTLGVPLFFTRYIYASRIPTDFPKLVLKDEVNKRMGKKLRRNQRTCNKQVLIRT